MALLNPPEIRLSMMALIARYLASLRGHEDTVERLVNSVAPPSLLESGKKGDLQRDVEHNLRTAVQLGLVTEGEGRVRLVEDAREPTIRGTRTFTDHVRSLVLSDELNQAPWGSQRGARDLTSGLAWFLTFDARRAPDAFETGSRSAKQAQERDFGPRHATGATAARSSADGDLDDDSSGWPIANPERWRTFRRWACSLGFAWRSPTGRIVPDPTPALRSVLPTIFADADNLPASSFVEAIENALPVLEDGRYRRHVEANWQRPVPDQSTLSASTTDALERLAVEGLLNFEDHADAVRRRRADGTTFSHVRRGRGNT